MARGAGFVFERQYISNRPVGLGFHILQGNMDPGGRGFRPRVVGPVVVWGFMIRGWDFIVAEWR